MTDGAKIKDVFDQLLFPRIFKTFRMAIHPRKMTIAFAAVVAIALVGWLMDLSGIQIVDWPQGLGSTQKTGMFRQLYCIISSQVHEAFFALARLDIPALLRAVTDSFSAIGWAVQQQPVWSAVFFVLLLVVLSIAGGAICRLAALQFAEGERPGLMDSVRFSCRRFWHLFLSPIAPLALVAVIGLFVLVAGLVGNIKYVGELLVGLGMPLILLFGAFMALLVIGTVAGFGLFFPAVAYEDTDCFIAVNNGFRYVFVRPWLFGFYYLLAGVYGTITYYFVRIVAFGMLWTSYKFLQLGIWGHNVKLMDLWPEPTFTSLLGDFWPEGQSLPVTMTIGRFLVYLCCLAVLCLLVAYCLSFYFTVNTVIYALLRKAVDGTAIEKVEHEKASQIQTPPQPQQAPVTSTEGTSTGQTQTT